MSIFDKFVAAVTPPESAEDRARARRDAQSLAGPDDWLGLALQHHMEIESCFEEARQGTDASTRQTAFKRLALVLNAHAAAEETVLYPMVAEEHKAHAAMAYQEQAMTKIQMNKLERMDPMSQDWLDKLEHIRGAVLHHMYEEEGTWFIDLHREAGQSNHPMLTRRFREEFERASGISGQQPSSMQTNAALEQSSVGSL
jgi:iron-sulfur cluster repair protein YtfE (RIC family)